MIHPRLKMTPFASLLKQSGNFKFCVLPRMSYPDHVWCPMLQYPLNIVKIAILETKYSSHIHNSKEDMWGGYRAMVEKPQC